MLRKSPASNTRAKIFKNADSCYNPGQNIWHKVKRYNKI